jgi:hypothetical protein
VSPTLTHALENHGVSWLGAEFSGDCAFRSKKLKLNYLSLTARDLIDRFLFPYRIQSHLGLELSGIYSTFL